MRRQTVGSPLVREVEGQWRELGSLVGALIERVQVVREEPVAVPVRHPAGPGRSLSVSRDVASVAYRSR